MGLDLMKLTFSDLKKLKLENFSMNAKFKLSDLCDSNWVKNYNSKNQ